MKRRWFQIHLSTAVVLMFVAGGLLWANMMPRWRYMDQGFSEPYFFNDGYGWPFHLSTFIADLVS